MSTQLVHIKQVTGVIELLSGLHIGAGDTEIHIGGTDSSVVKNPLTKQPYIPGSSLKGKLRALLEWYFGLTEFSQNQPFSINHLKKCDEKRKNDAKTLLSLFGTAPNPDDSDLVKEIGVTRLAFWDAALTAQTIENFQQKRVSLTEGKSENTINRIDGTAGNPRVIERVVAGAEFEFKLSIKVLSSDNQDTYIDTVLKGLRLLALDSLGGSGSRGYGKIAWKNLALDGQSIQDRFNTIELFK